MILSNVIRLRRGDVRWSVRAELESLLFDKQGLRLEQWLAEGLARVVKQGPHRTVYHVQLPQLDFHLKHNRAQSKRSKWSRRFRRSKARIEHDAALEVKRRGVPTFHPLAVGEAGGGESYLLTQTLPETVPLSNFLEHELPMMPHPRHTRLRQRIAKALGELLRQMHDAGIVHQDLHPANVLLQWSDEEQPLLYLIDLDAVRWEESLSTTARRKNLVTLNRWFILRSSRSDRLRFWSSYREGKISTLAKKSGSVNNFRYEEMECAKSIETETELSNQAFWRKLDPRCTKNNRRFRKARADGACGYVVTDFDHDLLNELMQNPDAPFEQPDAKWLKRGRSSSVIEMEIPLLGQSQRVVYKRFNVTKWTDPFAALFRPDPALRSWINGHGLRQRWIPTPRPLLLLYRRRQGLLREAYLLTAKIEPTQELHELVKALSTIPESERQKMLHRTIDKVAQLIRAMHQRQISHRDLKAGNVLVVPELLLQPDAQRKTVHVSDAPSPIDHWPLTSSPVWLIDLVGAQRLRKLSFARKVQNLTRLCVSFCDSNEITNAHKLRFLRTYLQWGLKGKQGWKQWWRSIARSVQAKIARNARAGRPLG